jgi:uncharacterized membrane protein
VTRRQYLDWLRGIGVLIMIEAHTLDSWTRVADRGHAYGWAIVIGGFGAPIFLLLAGVSLALAAGARLRKGMSEQDAARKARRRAWQIFGLAFLFRLQSAIISGGWQLRSVLKVDILNVMGVSMLAAAVIWAVRGSAMRRGILFGLAAIAVAMLTPIVRVTPLLAPLPDPIEWYFRPDPGRTTFTLFPWSGFLFAGAAIGLWLDRAQEADDERRVVIWLGVLGVMVAIAGYTTSFLPPIYEQTNFWTSSPTFFFLRLGMIIAAVPIAYAWRALMPGRSPLVEFGIASLFVYWIHVEMVYGMPSLFLHGRLSFPQALVAFVVFSLFLFWLVRMKDRIVGGIGAIGRIDWTAARKSGKTG